MVFGTAWYVRVDSKSVARLPLEDSVGIVVCVHKVASENVRIYGIYLPSSNSSSGCSAKRLRLSWALRVAPFAIRQAGVGMYQSRSFKQAKYTMLSLLMAFE